MTNDLLTPTERTAKAQAPAAVLLLTAAALIGLMVPNRADVDAGMMTHYMGLLASHQPWNLIIFMAVPVVLAETLAVTELAWLFRQGSLPGWADVMHRWAGRIAGPWFLAITAHLLRNAVVPLTSGMGWHGPADVIAVLFYLLGVVPLVGITLIEFGGIGRESARVSMRMHATFVGMFLIVAHIAMIFGMLDPTLLGWVAKAAAGAM